MRTAVHFKLGCSAHAAGGNAVNKFSKQPKLTATRPTTCASSSLLLSDASLQRDIDILKLSASKLLASQNIVNVKHFLYRYIAMKVDTKEKTPNGQVDGRVATKLIGIQ